MRVTQDMYWLFWDVLEAYLRRFGKLESDLYHVVRSLAYFAGAESDSTEPIGLSPVLWGRIKEFFARTAPEILR